MNFKTTMKRFFLYITTALALILATNMQAQSPYTWKESHAEIPEKSVNNPKNNDGIEVFTRPGTLIIRTPVKSYVKVLSILGQVISQTSINPGTFELTLNTHGIFIVKINEYTMRVAI